VVARQYYGLLTTLGGTNPDIVAATSFGKLLVAGSSFPRIV
jgi:hypothetical protein